jgi:hypothetical protein
MRHRPAAAALVAAAIAVFSTGRALACPEASERLLWHSCWGEAQVELRLLPEDLPLPMAPEAGERLTVTGAYTAREPREGGLPDPVGLFLRRGEVIGRNLARMDGILLIPPEGPARIARRSAITFGAETYDLTSVPQRMAFVERAAAAGYSVMQTHLLVIDGESDVAETENAPAYIRRLIFEDAHGIGIWQTRWPVTLFEAARAIVADVGPRMAMNLDMGSYDFCLAEAEGAARRCGVVEPGGQSFQRLSNLLSLSLTRRPL